MPPSARAAVLLRRVSATAAYTAAIKRRVEGVEILAVQMILCNAERIGKPLIMRDLSCTQELDRLPDVGIVDHTQNVVVGRACLLLCCNCKSASF